MESKLIIKNCRLYNSDAKDELFDIALLGGRIIGIRKSSAAAVDDEVVEDVKGKIAVPGFIDVHIQGAGGADVLDNTPEALEVISKTLARTGTTGYLGTTVVKPKEGNAHLKLMSEFTNKEIGGAILLGIHLEGPFINLKKKGGLAADSIYAPAPGSLDEIFDATSESLKMMTIAPEIPGNLEIMKDLF